MSLRFGRRALAGLIVPLVAAALVLAGCGGGTDRTKARVRLVNASGGYAQLDLREDGTVRQAAVAYGASADYADVDPRADELAIHAGGSPTALTTLRPALSKDKNYTLLAYGAAGALRHVLLDDNDSAPDSGRTLLRVINAAPDAGVLDVYVTAANETLAASVPVQSGADYGTLGSYVSVSSGSWRLRVAAGGSKTDLRLDIAAFELGSRQRVTLVLTPTRGGVLVNALALVQQGGVVSQPVAHARVRAVAGTAAGSTVSASAGGVSVLGNVASPAVGAYVLVPAGDVTPAVVVDGNAVAAASRTLVAGADYTLLVGGTAAAAGLSWLADDNALPTTANQARLRLVNGVAGATGPLAMTIDFLPLASDVVAGSASDYGLVDASTTARIAVTAAGTAQPLHSAIDQRLDAAGVYSLFVVGEASAPTGILRKDR